MSVLDGDMVNWHTAVKRQTCSSGLFCFSDEVMENKTNGLELPRYMY